MVILEKLHTPSETHCQMVICALLEEQNSAEAREQLLMRSGGRRWVRAIPGINADGKT